MSESFLDRMREQRFPTWQLKPGDIIRHPDTGNTFLILDVTANGYEWFRFNNKSRRSESHGVIYENQDITVIRDGEMIFP